MVDGNTVIYYYLHDKFDICFRTDNLLSHPRTAGVGITSVTFPNPHPSSFSVPDRSMQGYPQVIITGHCMLYHAAISF